MKTLKRISKWFHDTANYFLALSVAFFLFAFWALFSDKKEVEWAVAFIVSTVFYAAHDIMHYMKRCAASAIGIILEELGQETRADRIARLMNEDDEESDDGDYGEMEMKIVVERAEK